MILQILDFHYLSEEKEGMTVAAADRDTVTALLLAGALFAVSSNADKVFQKAALPQHFSLRYGSVLSNWIKRSHKVSTTWLPSFKAWCLFHKRM